MENIRCFTVIHKLKEIAEVLYFYPEDIIENNDTSEIINQQGFKILFKTAYNKEDINKFFMQTIFLSKVEIGQVDDEYEFNKNIKKKDEKQIEIKSDNVIDIEKDIPQTTHKQNLISVD